MNNNLLYNLPLELLSGANEEYAKSLYKLAKQLGFPYDYLLKILSMVNLSKESE